MFDKKKEDAIKLQKGEIAQLATQIAQRFGAPIGKINIQKFSDGEFQPIFLESIRGDYVFLVQSTYAPSDNLMELLMKLLRSLDLNNTLAPATMNSF